MESEKSRTLVEANKRLCDENDRLQAELLVAVGMASALPQYRGKHLEAVLGDVRDIVFVDAQVAAATEETEIEGTV